MIYFKSTQEEIRTPTPIQAPAPQAGASTNFATWVFVRKYINLAQNLSHQKPI